MHTDKCGMIGLLLKGVVVTITIRKSQSVLLCNNEHIKCRNARNKVEFQTGTNYCPECGRELGYRMVAKPVIIDLRESDVPKEYADIPNVKAAYESLAQNLIPNVYSLLTTSSVGELCVFKHETIDAEIEKFKKTYLPAFDAVRLRAKSKRKITWKLVLCSYED
jgi:hypothetical protein